MITSLSEVLSRQLALQIFPSRLLFPTARTVGKLAAARGSGERLEAMGCGRAFLHRVLVLSSLLLLASGEVFFEERFDGTPTVPALIDAPFQLFTFVSRLFQLN